MDSETKQYLDTHFEHLENKLDTQIEHQKDMCQAKHKSLNGHLKESPLFRDTVMDLKSQVKTHDKLLISIVLAIILTTIKIWIN